MKCPQCENEYVCGCESCFERNKDKGPWIRTDIPDGDFNESCPNCGFTKSCHWWFEEQFRQYDKIKDQINE